MKFDPKSILVLKNKGFTLALMGRFNEARNLYEKCLKIDPNSVSRLWFENLYSWKIGTKVEILDSFIFERINEISIKDEHGKTKSYQLPIYSGRMGTIFFVKEIISGRIMIVKIPKEADYIKKSIVESRILLTMKSHPNIVECFLVNTLFGTPHIFTEFIEGGDLQRWITNNTSNSIEMAFILRFFDKIE